MHAVSIWNTGTYTQDISCNKYNTHSLCWTWLYTVPGDRFTLNTPSRSSTSKL